MEEAHQFTNEQIAKILKNVAIAYSLIDSGKYHFQIMAYNKAADAVLSSTTQLYDLYTKSEKLSSLKGIGESLATHITELFNKGKSEHFDKILNKIPVAVFPLIDIPQFGPKTAYTLVRHFQLKNPDTVIEDVQDLAKRGLISKLEGFGEKSEKDLLTSISEYTKGAGKSSRMALPYAQELAEEVIRHMSKLDQVVVEPLGSLRRKRSTVGDIDLAAASDHPNKVIDHFLGYASISRVIEKGPVSASFLTTGGVQVDLMVQPVNRFGSLLQHFTGSKQHNVALRERAVRAKLSLSERGIKKKGKLFEFSNEKDFYKFLGLEYIEPELRENQGEIEAASKKKLPKLVTLSDVKGDLHIHSDFDINTSHDLGRDRMETVIREVNRLSYEYVGFADHNPSQKGLSKNKIIELIKLRSKKIDQLNKSNKSVRVFNLLEVDIKPDGELAIPNEALDYLDGIIVSIHSQFKQSKNEITDRIIKALSSHPKVKIFAHPTGRILNSREGVDADWEKVFKVCVENNIALEINSSPERLDLPDILVKSALEKGVKFCINTDSHSADSLFLMRYGVDVARRGWCEKRHVVNTFDVDEIEKWLTN